MNWCCNYLDTEKMSDHPLLIVCLCNESWISTLQHESMAESARILQNAESIDRLTLKAKKTKKRRKASAHKKQKQSPPTDHSKHYRLNLAEIPFVAGKVCRT